MMEKRTGCLIIHGFAGGVYEVAPLAEFLTEKGFNTACVKLKGHTEQRRDLTGVTYKDWMVSAEDKLQSLEAECERVVIIGFSMGGLIGVNLAAKYEAAALITLCTPIYHWDLKRVAANLLEDIKSRDCKNLRHYMKSATIPLPALLNFKILLARTKKILQKIECPLFIAQALKDDTVKHKSAEYLYYKTSSETKFKKYYSRSGHVICLSPDAQELFGDIEEFIRKSVIGSRIKKEMSD